MADFNRDARVKTFTCTFRFVNDPFHDYSKTYNCAEDFAQFALRTDIVITRLLLTYHAYA